MGKSSSPPDPDTTYERLPNEPDEAWQAFVIYRDMGPRIPGKPGGRSMENVRISLGKEKTYQSAIHAWSSKFEWGKRARKYDDELERKNRKVVEAKIPYWARQRERSHRLNMRLARDIRLKIREMLKHPITVEVRKDFMGESTVVIEPAKWTYNTVGNLAKIAAELEAGTIADAMLLNDESDAFDPSKATLEELRDFIANRTGQKPGVVE